MRTTLLALCLMLAAPTAAAANRGWLAETDEAHPWTLSVLGAYHYPFFVGASGLLGIPVAPRGFGSGLNDAFYVEVDFSAGLDLNPHGARPMFYLLAGARYQVKFYKWLYAYHALRLGLWWWLDHQNHYQVWPNGAAVFGVMFPFASAIAGHFEIGYPGIRLGLTFTF